MPDRQKYALRLAIAPQNAVEAVTYMDYAAVKAEIARAQTDYAFAEFDCINEDQSSAKLMVKVADIQVVLHNEWRKPVQQQVLPASMVPRPHLQ